MKTTANIIKAIENDKVLIKNINSISYYSVESFIDDSKEYINAIKSGRMINSIGSVSSSGMSRTIKFLSCQRNKSGKSHYYRQYWCFFNALGFSKARNSNDYFSISGCGMDMIFHTNYTNIHKLYRLGFISKKECEKYAQMTPTTI